MCDQQTPQSGSVLVEYGDKHVDQTNNSKMARKQMSPDVYVKVKNPEFTQILHIRKCHLRRLKGGVKRQFLVISSLNEKQNFFKIQLWAIYSDGQDETHFLSSESLHFPERYHHTSTQCR
jgi:hypothetical protein